MNISRIYKYGDKEFASLDLLQTSPAMTLTEKVGLWVLDLVIALSIPLMWTDFPSKLYFLWAFLGLVVLRGCTFSGGRPWVLRFCLPGVALFIPGIAIYLPIITIPGLMENPIWLGLWLILGSPAFALLVWWILKEEHQFCATFIYLWLWTGLVKWITDWFMFFYRAASDPGTRTHTAYGQLPPW